eukprot:gene12269-16452_t
MENLSIQEILLGIKTPSFYDSNKQLLVDCLIDKVADVYLNNTNCEDVIDSSTDVGTSHQGIDEEIKGESLDLTLSDLYSIAMEQIIQESVENKNSEENTFDLIHSYCILLSNLTVLSKHYYLLLPLIISNTPFTEQEILKINPKLVLKQNQIISIVNEGIELPDYKNEIENIHMIMECLVLLCQRRNIREELRKQNVYPIVRNCDYYLENDEINNTAHEIVNFLMGEEENNNENHDS